MLAMLADRQREIESTRTALFRAQAPTEAFEALGAQQQLLALAIEVTSEHPFLSTNERIMRLSRRDQQAVRALLRRARRRRS